VTEFEERQARGEVSKTRGLRARQDKRPASEATKTQENEDKRFKTSGSRQAVQDKASIPPQHRLFIFFKFIHLM